jgi:hypothetical protein
MMAGWRGQLGGGNETPMEGELDGAAFGARGR